MLETSHTSGMATTLATQTVCVALLTYFHSLSEFPEV